MGFNLTEINVLDFPLLEYLNCGNNQLTSLDISNQPTLRWLICDNNQFTSLDVSTQPDLRRLSCSGNQLDSLDISKNNLLGQDEPDWLPCFLEIEDMPSLGKVCVWELPFPPVGFRLCAEGSPNVYFTTDCSK